MASDSQSSTLSILLEECRKGLHNGALSLSQLVPVHQTLCRCTLGPPSKAAEYEMSQLPTTLTPIVEIRCKTSTVDQQLCLSLLTKIQRGEEEFSFSLEAERLFVLQYLMYPLSLQDSLRFILIPYMLSCQDDNVDASPMIRDFEMALLDLVVEGDTTKLDIDDIVSSQIWSQILHVLVESSHPFASRLLVKLVRMKPTCPSFVQSLYDKIWQALQTAIQSPPVLSPNQTTFQDHPTLATLSKDLLPVLTTKADNDGTGLLTMTSALHLPHLHRLWSQVFALWMQKSSSVTVTSRDELRSSLLAITTVLCPLLPHLVQVELPSISSSAEVVAPLTLPVAQATLWDLLYSCLAQGKSVLEDGPALSSILRRRALFLLNNVVTTPEWKQFVICFETLEMEHEQHLVDQIWESLGELVDELQQDQNTTMEKSFDSLTWKWMSLLFGCVLSSELPVIRKMGMYRILKTQDGSEIPKKKSQQNKNKAKPNTRSNVRILENMPPDFVLNCFLPSWNSLARSVGYTMHIELQNRKLEREDMIPLMKRVLKGYVERLDAAKAEPFWVGLWDWELLQNFTTKTVVLVFQSLAEKLTEQDSNIVIPIDSNALESLAIMVRSFFVVNSVVLAHRKEILQAISVMLGHTQNIVQNKKWSPMAMLQLLSLYDKEYFPLESEEWNLSNDPMLMNLKVWIRRSQQSSGTCATLATAFVDGQLPLTNQRTWDPENGTTTNEKEVAWAVLLFSSLSCDESRQETCSQLVWPAISKGLSNTAGAIMSNNHIKGDHVARAILLLENGCHLRQLSGLGNGDLVMDKTSNQLMPAPPTIENLLSSALDFILFHLRVLLSIETNEAANGSKQTSKTYTQLVSQLRTLHLSFPSSQVLSSAMDALLDTSVKALSTDTLSDNQKVMHVTSTYAALSAGANLDRTMYIVTCRQLVNVKLQGDTRETSNTWEHMARSILFYAKWACVSTILPLVSKDLKDAIPIDTKEAEEFVEWILEEAFEAVHGAAQDGIVPVFKTVVEAGKLWIDGFNFAKERAEELYVGTLQKLTQALLDLMSGATLSIEGVYMLNELCSLLFQPHLMQEEYERFCKNPDANLPIRDAFRELIKIGGTERAHINRSALCRATVGWLGLDIDDKPSLGLNAIPYKDDIIELLVHKGVRKSEAATNQHRGQITGGMEIPVATNDLSLSRAFVLVFLSQLPDPVDRLNVNVVTDLLEPVIAALLQKAGPSMSKKSALMMIGTPAYCIKMRAWQALCVLSRFVTPNIAVLACTTTFSSIQETIHSQIRYFVEIFGIKCAMMHGEVFGSKFLQEISRTDLTLQQVASLMVMGGNWIVGRHRINFFQPGPGQELRLRRVLVGAIPWLSSTQGFSRAIAQLLVYAVIPMVVNVKTTDGLSPVDGNSDWVLQLIYKFLDQNKEMARLRNKQNKFFEAYDVEEVCTPEGILSIPVDEGEEAHPSHVVDAMKKTLIDVYDEAHGSDAPDWKQMAEMVEQQSPNALGAEIENENSLVNFQRKIIPLDALNLAMESQREVKLQNAAGRRKQHLIVCASLVDKVPNLGGLARTAEIFAADRLIVPDKSVCKMDNFKSISVGAGDWIGIDEVRPEGLLDWLLKKKERGYYIFGLEQTGSSISLDKMEFPDRPTILLLGKEKEGIPVELLQAVDQCVEIPQLGIIRSLNVHVSGAIAIWEHTKQRRLQCSS